MKNKIEVDEVELVLPVSAATTNVVKDVVKDVVKELSERQLFIIDLISNEPTLSAKAISERFTEKVGITPRTVQRDLAVLQKKGILAREGGRKDGRWVIVQPQ